MEIGSAVELYDSDRLKIQHVVNKLREHVGTWRRKDEFVTEIMERFGEQGYWVDIRLETFESGGNEVYHPIVTISGRVETEVEYDHERQRHEVQANILDRPGRDSAPGPVAMPGSGKLWTPGAG